MIFVFGSNLAGVHGAGGSAYAMINEGAIYGQGVGLHGNSYAIPTQDAYMASLPLKTVEEYIADFVNFAFQNPEMKFKIIKIGGGIAGFTAAEIAPNFVHCGRNCFFDKAWDGLICPGGDESVWNYNFWGTFNG